jgi:hypothetical protein
MVLLFKHKCRRARENAISITADCRIQECNDSLSYKDKTASRSVERYVVGKIASAQSKASVNMQEQEGTRLMEVDHEAAGCS